MRIAATAILAATLLLSASPAAFAFEAVGTGAGTHMGSMLAALADLYALELQAPAMPKKPPRVGTGSIRWNGYGAAQLMADASCDADFHFFGVPAAHAQTGEFDYGKKRSPENLRKLEAAALLDYLKYLEFWLSKARAAFASGDPEKGLYLLGFASHSYQDLWAHRGITNGMHKTLKERMGLDVDTDEQREGVMLVRLKEWLTALPELLGEGIDRAYLDAVLSPEELKRPGNAKRDKILGRRMDVYWEAAMYGLFQGVSLKSLSYQQELQWDAEALSAVILDPRALGQAAALDDPEAAAVFLESRGYVF